jgi:hypothetical protein
LDSEENFHGLGKLTDKHKKLFDHKQLLANQILFLAKQQPHMQLFYLFIDNSLINLLITDTCAIRGVCIFYRPGRISFFLAAYEVAPSPCF